MFVSLICVAAKSEGSRLFGHVTFLMQLYISLVVLPSLHQANILLPWQRDDGNTGWALQGPLLDLEQFLGAIQPGN